MKKPIGRPPSPAIFRRNVKLDFQIIRFLREKTLCRVIWQWPDGSTCSTVTHRPIEQLEWLSTVRASQVKIQPAVHYGV